MPIRFVCPQCRNPIEVDDEYAGSSATCPYCEAVVSVPQESTWQADEIARARPAGGFGDEADAPPERAAVSPAARRYGYLSLTFAALGLVFFAVLLIQLLVIMWPLLQETPETPPTQAEAQEFLQREAPNHPLVLVFNVLYLMSSISAVVLGALGLRAGRTWQAIVGLVVGGLMTLCTCSGAFLQPLI
jgi:hypothetical protein